MEKQTIKIISWNVNGLRAVLKKGNLEWIKNSGADMVCLQETKVHEEQLSFELKQFGDYQGYFCDSHKKGYSGVAIYTKQPPLAVSRSIDHDLFDVEGRILIHAYPGFSLINIYFPNGQRNSERLEYKLGFYEHLLHFLKKYQVQQPNIVLCGDVNTAHKEIDLFHPKENAKTSGFLPEERAWIDKLIDLGFQDSFRLFNQEPLQYTWWDQKSRARDRNIGWRIDYFFVSEPLVKNLKAAYIMPEILGSDHCPVVIELSVP